MEARPAGRNNGRSEHAQQRITVVKLAEEPHIRASLAQALYNIGLRVHDVAKTRQELRHSCCWTLQMATD